ncbi:MAG: sulfotransferase, partial [Terracoccus sp.]
RTEGLGRLIEEDQLNPLTRARTAAAKARWRSAHGVTPGRAVPVYVVGLQRSGTNMLLRGLDAAPEVEVRGENDRTVFNRFRLRSTETLVATVAASRHRLVLVKPLCDSQRVDELLDLPDVRAGKAVWLWRDAHDRARSEVSKFGASNLQAVRAIAAGTDDGMWQSDRLGADARAWVRTFDTDTMSPETAAVLFWCLRNSLFFELGLDRRDDVLLLSYDDLVRDPETTMRRLCAFLDFPLSRGLYAHIEARSSHARRPLDVDPAVDALADEVTARLRAHDVAQQTRTGDPS